MLVLRSAMCSRSIILGILTTFSVFSLFAEDSRADDFGLNLPAVKKIEILGNRSFNDGELKKRMQTREMRFYHVIRKPRFRMDFLLRDIEALKSFYKRNGFFDIQINVTSVIRDEKSNSVVIRLMVNEGSQTVIRNLGFSGQAMIDEKALRKGLQLTEGKPYTPQLIDVDRYTLFRKFFEKGYLKANIVYNIHVDSSAVDLSWNILTGSPVELDSIQIGGNEIVSKKLIKRELTFSTGEIFDLDKVLQSKQNLYDTGYFNSVEIEPRALDVRDRMVNLFIHVRERKMGYLETGFGVGNVNGNRVFADWGQRNLFGRGYALHLKTTHAFRLFQENEYRLSKMDFKSNYIRNEGELIFPHVLSTWNTFTLGAFYERDATVQPAIVRVINISASVSRRFSRHTSLLWGYALERIQRQYVYDDREKSRRRSIDLRYTRDTRDYYFNPSWGKYISAEARYTGGFLGGEDNYYSLVGSFRSYKRVIRGSILAYRLRGGYGDVFGDSEEMGLPIETRFFAGGGNSVRGYKENSLGPVNDQGEFVGGRVLLLANVEYRFPIPYLSKYNFGGAVFVDGGNVWRSVEEIELRHFDPSSGDDTSAQDFKFGVGFGLRFYTPVGPIRLDFGFPMKKTPDIDYDYLIHISLGQMF